MRMWIGIPASCLCRKHLLGEHGELHKHRHNFEKRHNMAGRLKYPAQIDPATMGARHDELAAEMLRRGYNHQSPYEQPDVSYLPKAEADISHNIADLSGRCPDCEKKLILWLDSMGHP